MPVHLKKPIIDKIAFLLNWHIDPRVDKVAMKAFNRRIKREIAAGNCEVAHVKSSRYFTNFRVVLPCGQHALVQAGAYDTRRNKGGLRIELNPSRIADDDVHKLRAVLKRVLDVDDGQLRRLFAHALINRLHVAVDIHGLSLDDVLVDFSIARKLTVFAKRIGEGGRVEGYNFGAVSSDYQTAVYDKRNERVHRALLALQRSRRSTDVSLKENRVTQFFKSREAEEHIRAEVRCQKLRGLPVAKVGALRNRFERFTFVDLRGGREDLDPTTRQAFISMCRDIGAKAAQAHMKNSTQAGEVAKFWRSRRASWWQPQGLWAQIEGLLRSTRLFPSEAFGDEPTRRSTSLISQRSYGRQHFPVLTIR